MPRYWSVFFFSSSTEGAIGLSCRENRLHVQEDLMAIQLFDQDGRPTPDGEPCHRLIVTNLVYLGLPIIRYELNDLISLDPEPCPCGSSFRVIGRIQGRSDDLFWGCRQDREDLQYIFPDYISRAIITSSEGIEEYQAIQVSPDEVRVTILPSKDNCAGREDEIVEAVSAGIREVFWKYRCHAPEVNVLFGKPKAQWESGKLIRILRGFKVPEDMIL
jgi:phenylacetate-coenzyme A ligase PaaK-like adenylate-forming protein